MITKKTTLGLLAFAIAIGSAIGSTTEIMQPRTAWVKVMYLGSQQYICVNTWIQCSDFGGTICTVQVQTITGFYTVPARRNLGCAITLSEISNTPAGYFVPSSAVVAAE